MSASNGLPSIEVPYSRTIINQVRVGKGPALKQLRDAIAANPKVRQHYLAERKVEEENEKQRRNMMWVKDANSHVRRVDTSFRDLCTYTNPMNVRQLPDRKLVASSQARQKFHAEALTKQEGIF